MAPRSSSHESLNAPWHLAFLDPAARGELEEQPLVEAPGLAVVDVLDRGRKAQPDPQAHVATLGHLPVDEEPEAPLEGQLADIRHPGLFPPDPCHAPELQTVEILEYQMGQLRSAP